MYAVTNIALMSLASTRSSNTSISSSDNAMLTSLGKGPRATCDAGSPLFGAYTRRNAHRWHRFHADHWLDCHVVGSVWQPKHGNWVSSTLGPLVSGSTHMRSGSISAMVWTAAFTHIRLACFLAILRTQFEPQTRECYCPQRPIPWGAQGEGALPAETLRWPAPCLARLSGRAAMRHQRPIHPRTFWPGSQSPALLRFLGPT